MFDLRNKKNREKNHMDSEPASRIEQLQETIDRQNKELAHLRYLSEKSDMLIQQEEYLDNLIETYERLCNGVRESKKKYDELNKELITTMRQYRHDMKKFVG